jgi:ATPase subunit of ABC transporter with duplicated ATPase domains
VIIIHDRALIHATCEHLIILEGRGGSRNFHGNYSEWVRQQRIEEAKQQKPETPKSSPSRSQSSRSQAHAATTVEAPPIKSNHSWMSGDRIEERMGVLEERMGKINRELGDPDIWVTSLERANKLTGELDEHKHELDELEHEWLRKSGA